MDLVLADYQKIAANPERYGGKASRLARLKAAGHQTPAFVLLSPELLKNFAMANRIDFRRTPRSLAGAILEGIWPAPLVHEVNQAVKRQQLDTRALIVRYAGSGASATLRIKVGPRCGRGLHELTKMIQGLWADSYASLDANQGAWPQLEPAPSIHLILQELVQVDVSGTIWTRSPDPLLMAAWSRIDARLGLRVLVEDKTEMEDRYQVHRSDNIVTKRVSKKTSGHALSDNCQVLTKETPSPQVSAPCLSDEQVRTLTEHGLALEASFGAPMKISFGWAKERLWLFSVEPIEGLPPEVVFSPKLTGSQPAIWEHAPFVPELEGLVKPLTYSLARKFYQARQLSYCKVMGGSSDDLSAARRHTHDMVALIRGRMYRNLLPWYRFLRHAPWAQHGKEHMRTTGQISYFLGGRAAEFYAGEVRATVQDFVFFSLKKIAALVRMVPIIVAWPRYMRALRLSLIKEQQTDYTLMSLPEQIQALGKLQAALWVEGQWPVMMERLCELVCRVLRRMVRTFAPGEFHEVQEYLAALAEKTRALPKRALADLAHKIACGILPGRSLFLDQDLQELAQMLASRTDLQALRAAIADYQETYGALVQASMKLESHDHSENLLPILQSLKDELHRPERAHLLQQNLWRWQPPRLGLVQRGLYAVIRSWCCLAIRQREEWRLEQLRGYGLLRRLVAAIGHNLAILGLTADAKDVHWLFAEELEAALSQQASVDMRQIVAQRQLDWQTFADEPPLPDSFLTIGALAIYQQYPEAAQLGQSFDSSSKPPKSASSREDQTLLPWEAIPKTA